MDIRKALEIFVHRNVANTRAILEADPEWVTQKLVHPAILVQCFVQGVTTADTWYSGYKLPPNFENVVNYVAFHVQRKWKDSTIMLSLLDFEDFLRDICPENPFFVAWNVGTGIMVPVDEPISRQWISLDAIYRNATIALRDDNRLNEAFEIAFISAMG